jgi:hypothetical protein
MEAVVTPCAAAFSKKEKDRQENNKIKRKKFFIIALFGLFNDNKSVTKVIIQTKANVKPALTMLIILYTVNVIAFYFIDKWLIITIKLNKNGYILNSFPILFFTQL